MNKQAERIMVWPQLVPIRLASILANAGVLKPSAVHEHIRNGTLQSLKGIGSAWESKIIALYSSNPRELAEDLLAGRTEFVEPSGMTASADILNEVAAERCRQDAKWGHPRMHPASFWHLILSEEVGEAADAIMVVEWQGAKLREELVQVAAVAVASIESHDRQLRLCEKHGVRSHGEVRVPYDGWHLLLSLSLGQLAKGILEQDRRLIRRRLIELCGTSRAAIESLDTHLKEHGQ